ncbi:MAG: RimJ/RimL family protein N-acetyltransferase [Saprospiraceae bacterium]|jgi:RimJ/RimL family protein N-acetyltransferase
MFDYWGKGLATEGAKEVLKYGMGKLLLSQIYSWTSTTNQGSERVMQKLGMRFEGTFLHPNLPAEDPLCEHLIYRITSDEYKTLR